MITNETHLRAVDSALSALWPPMRRTVDGESGWSVTIKINCGCYACVGEIVKVWATDAPAVATE